MNEPAIRPQPSASRHPSTSRRWPMTEEAWSTLVDELGRLRIEVAVLAGSRTPDDGVVHLPTIRAARRLDVLSAVLDACDRIRDPERAVIGRRVTLLEPEGDSDTYALVFPGDGDPTQGWISADSPLGAAVLGCIPGDRVDVMAPAGPRVVTLVHVE